MANHMIKAEPEYLYIVVDALTGEELEREWYLKDEFRPEDNYSNGSTEGYVSDIKRESEDTFRVFVTPEY